MSLEGIIKLVTEVADERQAALADGATYSMKRRLGRQPGQFRAGLPADGAG
jgi:hypothetical protein